MLLLPLLLVPKVAAIAANISNNQSCPMRLGRAGGPHTAELQAPAASSSRMSLLSGSLGKSNLWRESLQRQGRRGMHPTSALLLLLLWLQVAGSSAAKGRQSRMALGQLLG